MIIFIVIIVPTLMMIIFTVRIEIVVMMKRDSVAVVNYENCVDNLDTLDNLANIVNLANVDNLDHRK